eukprot:g5593.t1
MYQVMDGYSGGFGAVYFLLLILVGSFFCLNLTLAVIWNEFVKSEEKAAEKKERAKAVRREFGGGAIEDARELKEQQELDAPPKVDMRKSYLCCGPTGANLEPGKGGRHKNCPIPFVRQCYEFVEHPLFEAFIVICIAVNTITLSMDKYPEDRDEAEVLEVLNFILTLIFIIEMVLKLIGLGLVEYVASKFNQFDAFIVFMSLVELGLTPPSFIVEQDGTGGGALSVLRTFRLFRLFKLARSWKSLQHLLRTMVKTLKDIANFAVLLVLFMYIFALVGMQFFANRYRFDDRGYALPLLLDGDPVKLQPRLVSIDSGTFQVSSNYDVLDGPYNLAAQLPGAPDSDTSKWNYVKDGTLVHSLCKKSTAAFLADSSLQSGGAYCLNPDYFAAEVPRAHFDDLLWAFTTVFQVLSGENWNTVMYDGWRAVGWPAVIYFICLMVMGVMIVLELFVAILLGNFEGDDDEEGNKEEEEEEEEEEEKVTFLQRLKGLCCRFGNKTEAKVAPMDGATNKPEVTSDPVTEIRKDGLKEVDLSRELSDDVQGTQTNPIAMVENGEAKISRRLSQQEKKVRKQEWELALKNDPLLVLNSNALFCLPVSSPFRRKVAQFTLNPWFDRVILVLILISSILLGVENPLWDPNGSAMKTIGHIDIFMTMAFNFEMICKVITLGFAFHERAYIRDPWNVLDFVIVCVSNIVLAASDIPGLKSLRSLRTLRVLRPLRLINRAPGLKLVVNALLHSLPKVVDVLVVCGLFFLIFGIVGINFLKGSLSMCDGEMHNTEVDFLHNPVWGDYTKLVPKGAPWAATDPAPEQVNTQLRFKQGFEWNDPYSGSNAATAGYCDTAPTSSNGNAWCQKCSIEAQCPGKKYFCYLAMVGIEARTGASDRCHCKKDAVSNTITYAEKSTCSFDAVAALDAMNASEPNDRGIAVFEDTNGNGHLHKTDGSEHFVSGSKTSTITSVPAGYTLRGFTTSLGACGFLGTQQTQHLGGGVEWVDITPQTFNNVIVAMSTLFEMSTTEGWVDIMWAACDSTGIEMQPKRDYQVGWVWFFIGFIVVGSFFVVNLFVGVVCDTFNEMREELGASFMLTETQKEWVSMRKKINKLGPAIKNTLMRKVPSGKWRRTMYYIVIKPKFEVFIMTCIIVNTILMACKSFGQSTEIELVFEILNYVFAIIFTIEAIMKLMGLGRRYFMDSWNVFDFIVVVGTNTGIAVKIITGLNVGALATIIRTFRVCRIVRLVQSLKDLRTLINALLLSLPSLANIGLLLFLMFFIFSIIGVQQFAKIALYDALDEHSNFQSFAIAFLTLCRACTGENWNGQMYSLAHQVANCRNDPPYDPKYCGFEGSDPDTCTPLDGCGSPVAYPFYITFTCFVTFVVLNVFVAVILEAFDDSSNAEDAKLTEEQWEIFCKTWCNHVTTPINHVSDAFKIDMNNLLPFFKALDEPMGFRQRNGSMIANDKALTAEIQSMDIITVQFQNSPGLWAEFSNVAVACAKRVMVAALNVENIDELYSEFDKAETIERKQSGKGLDAARSKEATVQLNAKQYFAALRIACAFRSHKFRSKIQERVQVQKNMNMTNVE